MYEIGCGVGDGQLRAARIRLGLSVAEMARRCKVSQALIRILEGGGITLPAFALSIGQEYGLDANDIAALACRATYERELSEHGRDARMLTKFLRQSEKEASGKETTPEPDVLQAIEYISKRGTHYRVIKRDGGAHADCMAGNIAVYILCYKSAVTGDPQWKRIYRTALYATRDDAQAELDGMAARGDWDALAV